jgi:hypothetical protein
MLIILSFTGATIYWAAWMAIITFRIRLMLVKNISVEFSERFVLTGAATVIPSP